MATYTETSLKIKKSDLVIYIIALIAFVLMIVVLMSDKIGVTKKVTSLLNNDNNHANAANQSNAQPVNNSQPAAIQPANAESGMNHSGAAETGNSTDQSSGTNNTDPTRQLVTELQQNSNNTANNNSANAQPVSNDNTHQSNMQNNSRINSTERNTDAAMDSESTARPARERDAVVNSSSTRNTENEPEISSGRNRSHSAVRARESRVSTPSVSTSRTSIIREPAAQRERINRNAEEAESLPSTRIRSSRAMPQSTVTSTPSRVTNAQPDENLTVVKKIQALAGDNLWKIAQRNGVRTINIILVNRLSNPDFIFPGQTINIPNK